MKTIYEDVTTKNTKEFAFRIIKLEDGSYLVIQQAFRIFPDNGKALKSERKTICLNVSELKTCAVNSGRQGRLFLDSQVFMQMADNK